MTDAKYNFDSKRSDYLTPPEVLDRVFKKIGQHGFSVDTCCSKVNIPATNHFIDGYSDGLARDWDAHITPYEWAWCNPPFNKCDAWVKKAYNEQQKGNKSVLLIPMRSETKFWHDYILDDDGFSFRPGVEVQFLRKGICFLNPDTGEKIKMKVKLKDKDGEDIIDELTGEPAYKLVDGVYKNPLVLVYFGEVGKTVNQVRVECGLESLEL